MSPEQRTDRTAPRSYATLAAFAIGVPLALGVLAAIEYSPLRHTSVKRYVEHPAEIVEVLLFCCALGALATKALGYLSQRAACQRQLLALWDGQPVPVSDAPKLRAEVQNRAGRLGNSWLVRRLDAVLDFAGKRGSAEGMDDQLRALADTDAMALDNSYALIRLITWAIPILGFLGTVLGITMAIAGVSPEVLEKSLSQVTDGLSQAFDTTALGLALTMLTMFLSFVTERLEQSVLEYVDHFADVQLAHRFERAGADNGQFVTALRQNTQVLLKATEQLVQEQAHIWSGSLTAAQQQWTQVGQKQQQQLTSALEEALDKTLSKHQTRLLAVEQQVEKQSGALLQQLAGLAGAIRDTSRDHQQALARVIDAVAGQTTALAHLQDDGKQLVHLQGLLHDNLAALQGSGAFEQAVQSLTAAIHLLTAKAAPAAAVPSASRLGARPGAAA